MAHANRVLPEIEYLMELREKGLTQAEMVEYIRKHRGAKVTRSAVATAFSRAGQTDEQPRYDLTLPWKVKTEHAQDPRARVLRFLGRRLAGRPLTADQNQRLDSLLRKLAADDMVIVYLPRKGGFHTVGREQAIKEYGGRQPDKRVPVVVLPGDELRVG